MNSDDVRRPADAPYRPAGPGSAASWKCMRCHKLSFGLTGRRKYRRTGLWQCVQCAGGQS